MAGTARPVNSRTINTRVCGGNVRIFQRYGRGMPELKIHTSLSEKRPSRFAAFSTRESKSSRCWGYYCNQIQWLLVKLSFDCGLRITGLRNLRLMNISDRMIVFTGKGGKRRYI